MTNRADTLLLLTITAIPLRLVTLWQKRKGLTKLNWREFEHIQGPVNVGVSSERMKENRLVRKRRIWRYLQSYRLIYADKACEMVRLIRCTS